MKKIWSVLLVFAMVLSFMPIEKAEAKTIKKTTTTYVGAEHSLFLIGYGTPKVVSKNPKVVSVKQNKNKTWIATAKKPGKAKVIVTGRGNKAIFHFTVKPLPTEKKFEIEQIKTAKNFLLKIKNQNKEAVQYRVDLQFVNSVGEIVDENYKILYCLGVQETTIHDFYINKEYEDVKLKFEVLPSNYKGAHKYFELTNENLDEKGLAFTVTNTKKSDVSSAKVGALFFDEAGEVIGYNYKHVLKGGKAEATEDLVIDLPYDADYKKITPATYQLMVVEGYDTKR